MGKQKIDIEYPLATKSPAIIWEQISSAHGLERWFADHVNEEEEGILKAGARNRECKVRPHPPEMGLRG